VGERSGYACAAGLDRCVVADFVKVSIQAALALSFCSMERDQGVEVVAADGVFMVKALRAACL